MFVYNKTVATLRRVLYRVLNPGFSSTFSWLLPRVLLHFRNGSPTFSIEEEMKKNRLTENLYLPLGGVA